MNNQSKVVRLDNVPIVFSNLDRPDIYFGEPGHHKVTIPVDGVVKAKINKVHAEFGVKNIAGLKETEENGEQITFKTNVHTKEGTKKFPRMFDRQKRLLDEQPERGDVVNLLLMAKPYKDYTCFYLDAVQLVERNSSDNVPFESLDNEGEELFPSKDKVEEKVSKEEKQEQATTEKMPWEE